MSPGTIHQRLLERALAGKYDLFRGLGGGLAVLGLILFVMALGSDAAPRAWHLFHVNWLYFTGLAGGSVAFVAVQKITNAKWSGLVIRFAEASVAFLPVSLLGLLLIFTLGYHAVYGPMETQLHGLQHSKEVWLSRPFMFGRLLVGLTVLYWVGWKLIRADLIPDMLATRGMAGPGRRSLFDRWTRGYDGSREAAAALKSLLGAEGDTQVLTRREVMRFELDRWIKKTSLGTIFQLGVGVALLVGVAIVYQVLSTDVTRMIPEYATLKAIGYRNRFLSSVVLQQAVAIGILGFVPGLAVSLMGYRLTSAAANIPVVINGGRIAGVLALAIVMCAISGGLALRKLHRADPAELY